jgi:hypothetical protein
LNEIDPLALKRAIVDVLGRTYATRELQTKSLAGSPCPNCPHYHQQFRPKGDYFFLPMLLSAMGTWIHEQGADAAWDFFLAD